MQGRRLGPGREPARVATGLQMDDRVVAVYRQGDHSDPARRLPAVEAQLQVVALRRAEGEPSPLHDALILTASAEVSEPVLQRFRRVGWVALWREGVRETYAPHPASAPNIERFFAFCG